MNVIDVGDEILRFANDQGHRKASKDTINWNGLKTKIGLTKFTTESLEFSSTPYKPRLTEMITYAECLLVTKINAGGVSETEQNQNEKSTSKSELYFEEDNIKNNSDTSQTCNISFNSLLKNSAEAKVRLHSTVFCQKVKHKAKRKAKTSNYDIRTGSDPKFHRNMSITNVSLAPKFGAKLSLNEQHPIKLQFQPSYNHELVLTVPGRGETPIVIIEHREEEKGHFEFDYYLWGSVEVIVWGKPYTLKITDVLDPKYNTMFQRLVVNIFFATCKYIKCTTIPYIQDFSEKHII